MLVRLDDMRGDLDMAVEVTDEEWAVLSEGRLEQRELDASVMGEAARRLFDQLLDREDVRRRDEAAPLSGTRVVWVP